MEVSNNTTQANFGDIEEDLKYRHSLKKASDVISVIVLIVIMFAMGTDIKWKQVWSHVKRPIGVGIGMLCQFVVMPLLGFSLIEAFGLKGPFALGVLLVSCCPGGAVSNMFCYFVDGDIPLSVTMTTLSSLMALGLMPFNFWLYGHAIDTGNLIVPYLNMIQSMAIITVPACVGIFLHWKLPSVCAYLTKPLSILGSILIVVAITLMVLAYPSLPAIITLELVLVVTLMPMCGLSIGYCLAWVMRQDKGIRKTISVECGIQNVAVAVAVLAMSPFPFEVKGYLIVFPLLYAMSMISICILGCALYQLYKRIFASSELHVTTEKKEVSSEKTF